MFTKSNNLIAQLRNDPLTQFVLWIIFFFYQSPSYWRLTCGDHSWGARKDFVIINSGFRSIMIHPARSLTYKSQTGKRLCIYFNFKGWKSSLLHDFIDNNFQHSSYGDLASALWKIHSSPLNHNVGSGSWWLRSCFKQLKDKGD